MLDEKEKKNIFSQWLEQLQQESWQLELLISGFALFGIWEVRDTLTYFTDFLGVNNPVNSEATSVLKIVIQMLRAAWLVFFTNLLIHVILRGLWIGAIGLRYVSGEIDYEKLKFSDFFTNYFKRKVGGFDDYIERLEKICSSIFAYTFLLFFIFLSFAFFIIFWILFSSILNHFFGPDSSYVAISLIANTVFGFLAFFVFIDFITLGLFKKIEGKSYSKIYGSIYRFFSFITLSFIYRPLLYNFLDTKYTRKLFWFSIPYLLLLTLVLPNFILEANPHFPNTTGLSSGNNFISKHVVTSNNYDDLREKDLAISNAERKRIRYISLSNYEITNSYASLFIRQAGIDEELLSKKYGITGYRKSGLRHSLFKGNVTDSTILNLEKEKSEALLKLIEERREVRKDTLNLKFKTSFTKRLNAGYYDKSISNLDDYFKYKRDSARKAWDEKIENAKEKKILKIQTALLEANQIFIDGVSYTDSLKCKFYIHPNMNEKGLLCYFPTDSLDIGEHLLTLLNKTYDKDATDSVKTRTIHIPFWKF